jgi:PKD repeat protein
VEACQSITFDGSGSKDPNGTIVLYEWDFDGGGVDVRSLSPTVNAAFQQPGARVVKLTVTDDEALTDDDLANLTVTPDVTPPQIRSAVPSPALLWAPDHQMVPVEIAVSVDDACQSTSCRIVNVTSNEAGSGRGRAARGADWQVIADLKLMLRAERGGGSTERVYTVTVTCVDAAGNQSSRDVLVTVPHDQRR